MGAYRRILSIVEITPHAAAAVIRRGQQMAELYGASLAVAGWIGRPVADAPAMSIRDRLAQISAGTAALEEMVARSGACRADVFVAESSCASAMCDLVGTWRPDLIVIAMDENGRGGIEQHGLASDGVLSFDVLTIRPKEQGLAARARGMIADLLRPAAKAAGVG